MTAKHFDKVYIDGAWRASASTDSIPVVNAATEGVVASVPAGATEDVEAAVSAARRAFDGWSQLAPTERGKYLARIGEALAARSEEIAATVSAEVGTPIHLAYATHVAGSVATLAEYAELATEYQWEESLGSARVVRAPVGVVAAITPWNFPLGLVVDKVAPALLAGCTVVLKPSEVAPLSAWALTEAIDEVGLPDGVFNLISGTGVSVGAALAQHAEVDMVSFTGSTRAGKQIYAAVSERFGRVVLEMGGKSANIVLDDADLERALPASVGACFFNSGQVCVALSRLLVPRSIYAEVIERLRAIVEAVTVGDPASGASLGPVTSQAQRERIRGYIQSGIDEGATLITGGVDAPPGLDRGYFVRPTLFADVENSMTIAQEEIFGPVLAVIAYDDEADAIRIANESPYGLSGGIWSSDPERAVRVARRMRTGSVRINDTNPGREAPLGGFKQSGIGRAKGPYGLDEYTELQTISGGSPVSLG